MPKKDETWDVSPMEYAQNRSITERMAQIIFSEAFEAGEWYIIRVGKKTDMYPEGKSLRMNRGYFDSLKKTGNSQSTTA